MAKEFKLPEVGEGIDAGTVVSVLVAVGDEVSVDQPVLELETDKAVVEVPSSVAGRVESIGVQQGQEARVGQVILTVGDGGTGEAAGGPGAAETEPADAEPADAEPAETGQAETGAATQPTGGTDEASKGPPSPRADSAAPSDDGRREGPPRDGAETGPLTAAERQTLPPLAEKSSTGALIPAAPSVRRLAREKGLDIRQVPGSGILGRISADDLLRFADGGGRTASGTATVPAAPLPDFSKWGGVERKPMSGIRKATVRAMANAWSTVPMVTHFDKTDITEFERLRKRYGAKAEAVGAKLTPTAMIIRIVAAALRRFPDFNASIDVEAQEIVYKSYVNVGVAVDTDAGLLVPVIRDADKKSMVELARELGELAEKARDRKLSLEEMQGGNFSVSNLGGIGGTGFTPIVNPPDVAILGVSRGGFEPVFDREKGEFVPQLMMPLALSYDHRLIDGASAARFLRWLCEAIEEPFLLALEG
ncbi:MAG: 2-oxo acid dehydrogenase subunit E2 [Trueperaceae bacterium]